MGRLNQALLHKVARRLGKTPQYIREQVSRRASREGVVSSAALVMWARDLGIGVASAVNQLPPHVQQQLSVPRVVGPRPGPPAPRGARAGRPRPRRARTPRGSAEKWVFISHASEDKKVAERLVDLLRAALNIPADKILCTSVDGYRLAAGSETDAALRRAVLDCSTLIGIISPASRRSTYVLLELGARWGAGKHLVPVMAGGVTPGELRGPLARLNALDCGSRAGVLQLIGDLGTVLKIERERPEVFDRDVDRLVRASKAARAPRGRGRMRRGKPR
jgi:hypothetical protein